MWVFNSSSLTLSLSSSEYLICQRLRSLFLLTILPLKHLLPNLLRTLVPIGYSQVFKTFRLKSHKSSFSLSLVLLCIRTGLPLARTPRPRLPRKMNSSSLLVLCAPHLVLYPFRVSSPPRAARRPPRATPLPRAARRRRFRGIANGSYDARIKGGGRCGVSTSGANGLLGLGMQVVKSGHSGGGGHCADGSLPHFRNKDFISSRSLRLIPHQSWS